MRKLNDKGFTLVELLAVLVILIAIMGIAIPTISSSLERTKAKQNEARYKILESATEQYVTDYKNAVYTKLGSNDSCFFYLNDLSEYLSNEDMKNADGEELTGRVIFKKPNNYSYTENSTEWSGLERCK